MVKENGVAETKQHIAPYKITIHILAEVLTEDWFSKIYLNKF